MPNVHVLADGRGVCRHAMQECMDIKQRRDRWMGGRMRGDSALNRCDSKSYLEGGSIEKLSASHPRIRALGTEGESHSCGSSVLIFLLTPDSRTRAIKWSAHYGTKITNNVRLGFSTVENGRVVSRVAKKAAPRGAWRPPPRRMGDAGWDDTVGTQAGSPHQSLGARPPCFLDSRGIGAGHLGRCRGPSSSSSDAPSRCGPCV